MIKHRINKQEKNNFFLQRKFYSILLTFIFATLANKQESAILLLGVALLFTIFILNSNVEDAFCWSLLLVPNIRILDGIGYSFIVNALIALPLVNYFFRFGIRKIPKIAFVGCFSLLIMEMIHDLLLCNLSNCVELIGWALNIFLCMLVSTNSEVFISKNDVFSAFSTGIIFSAFSYIISTSSSVSSIIYTLSNDMRFVGFAGEPNYYALYICLAIACILNVSENNMYKFAVLVMLVGIGFMTGSKMCILLMTAELFLIFFQIFNNKKDNRKNKKFLIISLIGFAVFAVIFRKYLTIIIQNFFRRLGQNSSSGLDLAKLTTGRSVIFLEYIRILFSNLNCFLVGYGFRYNLFLGMSTGHVAHNTYLDFMLSWGILGSIVSFIIGYKWISVFKQVKKIDRVGIIHLIPLIILLINFLDLSCLSANMFAFVITIALLQWIPDNSLENL